MCFVCVAGYRAILDAMGSFAGTTDTADIEDLSANLCPRTRVPCKAPGRVCAGSKAGSGTVWFTVRSVAEVFTVFAQYPGKSVKLIGADTGRGVWVWVGVGMSVGGCECGYGCACMFRCRPSVHQPT